MNVDLDCDFVLTHMLLSRLDTETARAFEREYGSTSIPESKTLSTFLEIHCNGLLNISGSSPMPKSISKASKSFPSKPTHNFLPRKEVKTPQCVLCSGGHNIYTCSEYLNKTQKERYAFCKSRTLCFSCLSCLHTLNKCKSKSACRKCGSKKHHTTLHWETEKFENHVTNWSGVNSNQNREGASALIPSTSLEHSFTACTPPRSRSRCVILGTAIVEVQTYDGTQKKFL